MKYSKPIIFSLIGIILVIVLFFTYIGVKIASAWDETYRESDVIQHRNKLPDSGDKLITILLLGIEQRGLDNSKEIDDPGRSDAILLLLLNTNTGKITALSIPRDIRVRLQKNHYMKLTDVYTYGPETSITLVEDLLKFPVDYYVAVTEKAFIDFIDMINGVTIDVEKKIAARLENIDEGKQHMDGSAALSYIRFRNNREGDFGRMNRMQQIMDASMHQALNIKTFFNINRFINLAEENIIHNIPWDSLKKQAVHLPSFSADQFEKISIEGKNVEIDSLWYVIPDTNNLLETRKKLRLELKASKDTYNQ